MLVQSAKSSASEYPSLDTSVDFPEPLQQPLLACARGLHCSLLPDEPSYDVHATSDIHVSVQLTVSSDDYNTTPFSVTRAMSLDDFRDLHSRLETIAAYGEDFYEDEASTQNVWMTYARLIKEAAAAPDISEYLAQSHLGRLHIRQVE